MSPCESATSQPHARRVLVVKTSSPQYVRLALARVHATFPGADVAIWTEERHSEEYYQRPDVDRVILYRSARSLRALRRELADFEADLIVTQRTFEPEYEKMHLLALALDRGPGLILDEAGNVCVNGTWGRRVRSVVGATVFRLTHGKAAGLTLLTPIMLVLRALLWIGRIGTAPLVLLFLLVNAARIEWRRARFRRERGAGPL